MFFLPLEIVDCAEIMHQFTSVGGKWTPTLSIGCTHPGVDKISTTISEIWMSSQFLSSSKGICLLDNLFGRKNSIQKYREMCFDI